MMKQKKLQMKMDHTEMYVNENQAQEITIILPKIYDEPFGDSSAIPMKLVSILAKKNVSVFLEMVVLLFCDTRYSNKNIEYLWKNINIIPKFIKEMLFKYPLDILKPENKIL